MDNLFGLPKLAIPLSYYAYRRGDYTPSEVQPIICIRGKRKWYAPWSRHPDQCHPGMSQDGLSDAVCLATAYKRVTGWGS